MIAYTVLNELQTYALEHVGNVLDVVTESGELIGQLTHYNFPDCWYWRLTNAKWKRLDVAAMVDLTDVTNFLIQHHKARAGQQ